jgi:ferredoxin-fold anticodon binding domain-containing protein
MKNKKIWIAMAVVLAVCIGGLWAAENKTNDQITIITGKDTLKGLQGVYVIIEDLEPEVEKLGLTRQQLQTDVELKLRQNSIKVLSEEEWFKTREKPHLHINVSVVTREESRSAVYVISVNLYQYVFLARDITKVCDASTWKKETFGSVGLSRIETIRESVKDDIDKFINDYLAVNPKK